MPKKYSDSVRIYYPKFNREELIRLLKEKVSGLSKELPLKTVALFGSYAKNRHTAASDIDLFVVIKNQSKDKAYHKIYYSLGIDNLELHLYTSEEYEKLRGDKHPFIREIEETGTIIFKET